MRHGIQFFIRVYFYDCNVFVAIKYTSREKGLVKKTLPGGVEPPTSRLTVARSNQLS